MRGERRLLGRMIRNLLDNADHHGTPPVRVMVRGEGSHVILEVADGGEGVPEAERERVFSPFHRLAGDGEGAGPWPCSGAADCAAAWRRRGGRAETRSAELFPH